MWIHFEIHLLFSYILDMTNFSVLLTISKRKSLRHKIPLIALGNLESFEYG